MIVFDASAVLAYLIGEEGADEIEMALLSGETACSSANWSEVVQKSLAAGRNWSNARDLLLSSGMTIEPVTREDGEWAALYWTDHQSLSLGDRLCLALAHRLNAEAWTADHSWGKSPGIHQIRA